MATQEEQAQQAQIEELREQVESAYAFVEGQKSAQAFQALTPEECFDQFIERIEGKGTQTRPNVLNRIKKIENDVLAAIAKIKAMAPGAFRRPDPEKDANTKA